MTLIEILPVIKEPTVYEGMIQLPEKNKATSEEWMRSFYGDELMDSPLPLTEEKFLTIYEMSTDAWKSYWQYWKNEGLFS